MRIRLIALCAAAILFAGAVAADEEIDKSKPIELSTEQMDQITAGVGSGAFPGAGAAGWSGGGTGHGLFSTCHFDLGPTGNTAGVWVPRTPGNPGA